ncbi:pro-opiomelanocortin A-like [Lampris incognitus]|uniref:pro-opiomelanocortin A-like n=1 Tax=Lampris incognitus TaxID=2546036 RepID=UPI0024B6126F|nr:pro-opiomelanocortin A-like [Lampris incognitus]
MCPVWLLVVAVVGVARGAASQCWEHPVCQEPKSESSVLECIHLCRSDLTVETPAFPGDAHLQPLSLSSSSLLPPADPHASSQDKRSYSMEHFRWGKPRRTKRYGGLRKSWDEKNRKTLMTLFKAVFNKNIQQMIREREEPLVTENQTDYLHLQGLDVMPVVPQLLLEARDDRKMCPMWLLVVAVVGVARGAASQCWEHPVCQEPKSESSVLECIHLCRSDLTVEMPVFPGDAHLQPLSPSSSSLLPPADPHASSQDKRSYSMEHFCWSKPRRTKRYGGFMKRWDEKNRKTLMTLFKAVFNKDRQQMIRERERGGSMEEERE